jgi:hypothetical protein
MSSIHFPAAAHEAMSIAVSAIVRPSRTIRFLIAGAGLSLFAAACAVGVFASAHASTLAPLAGPHWPPAFAVLMHAGSGSPKTHRLIFLEPAS